MAGYAVGDLASLISGSKQAANKKTKKRKLSAGEENGKDITLRNGKNVHLDEPIFNNKKLKKQLKSKLEPESDEDEAVSEDEEVSEGETKQELSDEENEDSDNENETTMDTSGIKTDSESEEDDEDDDNEDEDDDDDDDLDKLLADDNEDDDDEDVADDGEDVKVEKQADKKAKKDKKEKLVRDIPAKGSEEEKERHERTIFVGNIPLKIKKMHLKKLFKKYGTVESVRMRCVPVADTRVTKKVAMIKKDFHPERNSLHAYVRFEKKEDALKAVAANGMVYKNHHLRVNMSNLGKSFDENKSIFIGNIPFNAEDDELWKLFESCGKIVSVRLVRDAKTTIGKGFGYINFESSDAVELALQMTDVKLRNRELRIKRSNIKDAKKEQKPKGKKGFKKSKAHKEGKSEENGKSPEKAKLATIHKKAFQGKVSDKKKNKKFKKGKSDPKKKLAKAIAPKQDN